MCFTSIFSVSFGYNSGIPSLRNELRVFGNQVSYRSAKSKIFQFCMAVMQSGGRTTKYCQKRCKIDCCIGRTLER